MEQILLAYGFSPQTVVAIMMLYKNAKVKVCSLYGNTDYFVIVAGALQGDTSASYLLIVYLDCVLDIIKDNGFNLAKERSRRYLAKTITDYADDIAIVTNTPVQTIALQHSLARAASGIGLHVNAEKMEYMSFNQRGDISTINGSSLKRVDKFPYLGSSVSSTKNDINTSLAKAWTAIDRLSVIWKSYLTDKIKSSFSKQRSCRYCCMDALHGR